MTPAGKRHTRIEIQAYAGSTSATGAQKPTWTIPGILRWARPQFVSGGQQDSGTRNTYAAAHQFIVPKPTPVTIKDRVRRISDGALFDVVAVDTTDSAEITIFAIEGQRVGS